MCRSQCTVTPLKPLHAAVISASRCKFSSAARTLQGDIDLSSEQNGKHTDVFSLTLNDNSRDTRPGQGWWGEVLNHQQPRAIRGLAEFSWCNI